MSDLDREKVLPLVETRTAVIEAAMNLSPDHAKGYMRGMVVQRDADWERVWLLVEAAIVHVKECCGHCSYPTALGKALAGFGIEVKP